MLFQFVRPDRYFHAGSFPMPELKIIRISDAPDFLCGFRIGFLSDVHLRPRVSDEKLHTLMDKIRETNADMLLLGGDYAETDADCRRFFRFLSEIVPKYGCYGVFGNNDFICRDSLREIMAQSGVRLLLNEAEVVSLPEGRLCIAGCDDHKYGIPDTQSIFPDSDYRILLSHQPCMPDCTPNLMLCGHTHGGQINAFGITPYFIGFEFARKLMLIHGEKRIGDMRLFVGKGIGVSRLPIRIGTKAEIYLFEFGKNLKSAES